MKPLIVMTNGRPLEDVKNPEDHWSAMVWRMKSDPKAIYRLIEGDYESNAFASIDVINVIISVYCWGGSD